MSTEVIAFVSRKGGVGKTTCAVSLAACLAETGRRVLLLDLDPQASASLSLGVERSALAPSMADIFLRAVPLEGAIRPTATPGLDLVTASIDLQSLDSEARYQDGSETVLRDKLANAALGHDLVLIDCPPSLNLLSRNAVAASSGYVVPAVPHFLAVEGIQSMIDAIDRLRVRCAGRTRLLGVLPTMVDYRTKLTGETLRAMRQALGQAVFGVEIRINVRLAEAPAAGQSILDYDSGSTGAGSYRLAAEELLLRLDRESWLGNRTADQGRYEATAPA